jgi:hypothetical protein
MKYKSMILFVVRFFHGGEDSRLKHHRLECLKIRSLKYEGKTKGQSRSRESFEGVDVTQNPL